MDISKIFMLAIAATAFSVLVSNHRPEFVLLLQLTAVAAIGIMVIDYAADFFMQVKSLAQSSKLNSEYISLLLKALVIAIAGRVVGDICSDTGNKAVATCVDYSSRLCIIALSLPMLKALTEIINRMIKQ